MQARITSLFPLGALLFSLLAYAWPQGFAGAKPMIVPMLGIVMLSMGMTLTWSNFTEVLRRPAAIGLGVAPVFGHALPGLGGRPGAGSAATSDGGAGAAGGLSGRDRIESGLLSGQGRCCLLHHP